MAMRMSNMYVADRRLYLNKDGGVVEALDLIGKGCRIPMEQAERPGPETPDPPNEDAAGATQRIFGFRISCTTGIVPASGCKAPAIGREAPANVPRTTETRRQRRRRAERTRRKEEPAAGEMNQVTTESSSERGGNDTFRRSAASDICFIVLAVLTSATSLPLLPFQTYRRNAA